MILSSFRGVTALSKRLVTEQAEAVPFLVHLKFGLVAQRA